MESRKGPKFRKKKKKKGDEKTLAERIMQEREAAAQEAERNSSKSQESSPQETGSGPKATPQATPKDLSESANTPGSEGRLSPSESVDISHLTKDSDQKKRTPTPEPTLSASHSNQLPGHSSAQKPSEDSVSPAKPKDNKAEPTNNTQTSYQQPLQPAYATYIPENSLSDQSKSQQKPQHQIPPENGVHSEVGRNSPVTSNHIKTTSADTTATTTTTTTTSQLQSSSLSPQPPPSSSSSSVKGQRHISTNSSSVPTGVAAGREANPVHQQSNALAHPETPNSDYNKYMSLAQKIVLQRKIVAVCDSVTTQQPQTNPGFEPNAEKTKGIEESNNQLPTRQIPTTAPWNPVSCQEPHPISDFNQQGNFTAQNLSEYRTLGNPSNQAKNQQPVLRNGLFAQNPQRVYTLPKDPVNEDLDLVNKFELEALEKMVDHDLQSLVSGTSADENTPVINKDLKNKVLSEEFQRKIDRFLHDI